MNKNYRIAFVAVLTACFFLGGIVIAQAAYNDVMDDGLTYLVQGTAFQISCSSRDGEEDCFCPEGCCRNQTSCHCCGTLF